MRRVVLAALSFLFLAGWVVGLPAALSAWGHWPISGLPTGEQIRDLPATVLTDTALFGVLTVVVWVVWLAFTVSVAAEVIASVGSRPVAVPMCGPLQRIARSLVVPLLMSVSSGSVSAAGASGAGVLRTAPTVLVVDQNDPGGDLRPVPMDRGRAGTDEHGVIEVRHHDTYWAIAERVLGDGLRWREIRDLNTGRVMPDGHVLGSNQGELRPGWTVLMPAPRSAGSAAAAVRPDIGPAGRLATEAVVRPGDSMWAIAEGHLTSALGRSATDAEVAPYCSALIEANRSRLVDPADPDLIYSGQAFVLPPIDLAVVEPPRPDPGGPPGPGPVTTEAPPPPPRPAPTPAPTAVPTTSPSTTPATSPSTQPTGAETTPPVSSVDSTAAQEQGDGDRAKAPWLLELALAGMALAGVVLVLERRRRAQQRHRKPGERVRPPKPRLRAAEAQLQAAAALLDGQLVDLALRVVAAAAGGAGPPRLRWVEARGDTVRLALDEPAEPPRGFRAEDPDRWRLAVPPSDLVDFEATPVPPFPALCPVGATVDGAELLVDLETIGVLTVGGDDRQRQGLLRAIAVAAATAPWSPQPRVLLVGMAGELAALPNVEVVSSLGEALDVAEAHVDRVARALRSIRCASVVQARSSGITPDAWEPVTVISAQRPNELESRRLVALSRMAGHAMAIICPHVDGLSLSPGCVIDTSGDLRVRGVEGLLRAHRLVEGDLRVVVDLLEDAQLRDSIPRRDLHDVPSTRLPIAPPAAQGLDQLLSDVDVVIQVLGDVAASRRPPDSPKAAWPDDWAQLAFDRYRTLEVLCYLALREGRAAMEDLQAALFPAGTNAPRTYHNAVTGARRAVGEELFPHPEEGYYDLSERVVTDYGLLNELVAQADDADDVTTTINLLTEALGLVDGEPFVGPGRGFAWVGPHRGMIVAEIIDAAEQLAEAAIANDDWRKAEWAARQGLRAFPADERMYRVLMRAAHAAGNIAGVQHAYRELLDALADPDTGVEPEDTVHPETIQLLQRLTGRATA